MCLFYIFTVTFCILILLCVGEYVKEAKDILVISRYIPVAINRCRNLYYLDMQVRLGLEVKGDRESCGPTQFSKQRFLVKVWNRLLIVMFSGC